ncbi:hypothetical protein [Bradyrhizobium sp. 151]|uniref:hypothetical protein n=1 Tax=Bradyrhizobium sp. 151 TaxID=2782626 RepID=UPI001FFBEA30|nr:hypothetical protein [Bradyrhizobium sp. 151]MCK1657131.1 hypothetical protein [Bradyrhizobium sp. 151]
MSEAALRELIKGQVATMMAVVAVAGNVVERLVLKGVLSVEDGRAILSGIAEELRNDGDDDQGKYSDPAYRIANEIEKRAFALKGPDK